MNKKSISCKEEKRARHVFVHSFDKELAIICGIEAACIYTHIRFWIEQNELHQVNQFEGKTWTYMTYEQISETLGYLTPKQARLGISKLLEHKLIIKGDFSKDRFVKPTYYALCDENESTFSNNSSDVPKRAARSAFLGSSDCPNGQLYYDKDIRKNTYIENKNSPIPLFSESGDSVPTEVGVENLNRPKKSKKTKTVSPEEFPVEVFEVGQTMIEDMKVVKPDCKIGDQRTMLHSIDLMIRIDKRKASQIVKVFRWALAHRFWSDKFFKPDPAKYLREKYDQVDAQMNAKPPEKPRRFAEYSKPEELKKMADEWQAEAEAWQESE